MLKKSAAVCLGMLWCGSAHPALLAQAAASTRDGVYTAKQAQRGKLAFGQLCASCHGDDLGGLGQAPALTGDDFIANWEGQTLADLFTQIQTTMPADKPATLSPEQTADLMAYLLSANKFPDGKAELSNDPGSLKQIRIDKPKAPEAP